MKNMTPVSSATFQDFGLHQEIQDILRKSGFERPTEIQEKAIPILLAATRVDFHGQAQTGTGKTLAFGLPLLQRIDRANKKTQALIIAPTRELAVQICDSLRPLAASVGITIEAIYGGVSMEAQLQRLKRGVNIVVGTPGRILDHTRRRSLTFSDIKTLILDEADIMLDMGFKEDIDAVLTELSEDREIWLFSATVKGGIYSILKTHMKSPQSVRVSKEEVANNTTKHYYCMAPQQSRLNALCRFIECNQDFYGFIFCQTKILTSQIAEQLLLRGYRVGALHGDLSQGQRNMIIKRFKNKDFSIVVATDVAARGIDVANLSHVINFSFPDDQESYVHRSGRTGRAGREGVAITFINKHELRAIRDMQRKFNITMEPMNVPDRAAIVAMRMQTAAEYIAQLTQQEITDALRQKMIRCEELVNTLSDADCRKALSALLYDTYLKQIEDGEQFSETPHMHAAGSNTRSGDHDSGDRANVTELSLNVGSDDGVQREDITAILENKSISLDFISKIRILKRCTFIHVQPDQLNTCLESLNNTIIGGRTVRATRVNGNQFDRGGGNNRFGNSGGGSGRFSSRRREGGREGGGREGGFNRSPRGPEVYQPNRSENSGSHGERDYNSNSSSHTSGGDRDYGSSRFGGTRGGDRTNSGRYGGSGDRTRGGGGDRRRSSYNSQRPERDY